MSSLNPTTDSQFGFASPSPAVVGQAKVGQPGFVDRRKSAPGSESLPTGQERRQFASSYSELSQDGAELGEAVDRYKMTNRRRFVTYDEILEVVKSLGYQRPEATEG